MLISSLVLILLSTLSSSHADCGCNKLNRPDPVQEIQTGDSLQESLHISTRETKEESCYADNICDSVNTVETSSEKVERKDEELNVETEDEEIDVVQIEDDFKESNNVQDLKSGNGKLQGQNCAGFNKLVGI